MCVVVAVALGVGVTGCAAISGARSFVAIANADCAKMTKEIAELPAPRRPSEAIGYALDVFTRMDRIVSQLRGIGLPSQDAAQLRARWLDPAQRSLQAFRPELSRIRAASLAGDRAATRRGLAALRELGRPGVDGSYLASYGLDRCLPLFAPVGPRTPAPG